MNLNGSPKVLYEGCLLSTITHAVWARKYPFAKYLHYWDGNNCHFNDMESNLATISFFEEGVVGAIFRKGLLKEQPVHLHIKFLQNLLSELPDHLRKQAEEETVQYFIQTINGEKIPVISNIFWSEEDVLVSSIDQIEWNCIWQELIGIQLLDTARALSALQNEYALNEEELELILLLFNKKIENPNKEIKISLDSIAEQVLKNGDFEVTINLLEKLEIFISTQNK